MGCCFAFLSSYDRNLDGFFWGLPTARNLWRKSFFKYGLWPEINHRIIGIYTDITDIRNYGGLKAQWFP